MKRLFWLAGLALAAHAGAQELQACGGEKGFPAWVQGGVYSGTIGKLPIYLQLSRQNTDQTAYFYQSKGVNLQLTPFHDGEGLILQESGWNVSEGREVSTGCLSLSASGKNLTGRWTTPDVKGAQPVTLTPLNVAALPLNLPASPKLLEMKKTEPLTFLKLNRPWVKVIGGLKEPYSGIVFPRPAGATAALNSFLQDHQLDYAAQALDCSSMMSGRKEDLWFDFKASIDFQTPHLLSLTEGGTGYCGGAHPFLMFTVYTVNKQTGKLFKPTDLWPKLTSARLEKIYIQRFPRDKEMAQCREETAYGVAGLQWQLTREGLAVFNNGFSEASRACRTQDVTLPYAQLRAEANRSSPYYREIYR